MKKSPIKAITPAIAARAIGACLANAENYLKEAEILNKAGRPERAAALAILGLEEVGKVDLLGPSILFKTEDEWNRFWTHFTEHGSKQARSLYALLRAAFEKKGPMGFDEIIAPEYRNQVGSVNLDVLKQRLLYVGYDPIDGEFKLAKPPQEMVDRLIALLRNALSLEPYRNATDFGLCKEALEDLRQNPRSHVDKNAEGHYRFQKAFKEAFAKERKFFQNSGTLF